MGCDIHAYVEYANVPASGRDPYWSNFTRNGGGRNYILFGVLAGVRFPQAQLYEPKGMPEGGLGFYTSDDYWTYVAPEKHPEWADTHDDYTSLVNAERWVASGSSIGERDQDGRLRRVSGPDWHSHSWLTADELEAALAQYSVEAEKKWPGDSQPPSEWKAMLAGMRVFEAAGQLTRLVFWFDN